jgi:lipoprotein-anchoring transpeptidase ErfK/SrfK
VRRVLVSIVVVLAGVGVAAPQAEPPLKQIVPAVTVAGVPVGGLTSERARTRVQQSLERPLIVHVGEHWWSVTPSQLGAVNDVDAAVAQALDASGAAHVAVHAGVSLPAVRAYVRSLAPQVHVAAMNARLVGITGIRPNIEAGRPGVDLDGPAAVGAIRWALRHGLHRPLRLPLTTTQPWRTAADLGPIVVIQRYSNRLHLWYGSKHVRDFRVATGQSAYPTPDGDWHVVTMQRNPWWTPPNSPWAAGAKPIPPGPGNPLGTRWMGLDAAGVGMHGTPDAASIGYSASHGCIRMLIPDAEWLFEHVKIGTPVFIRPT